MLNRLTNSHKANLLLCFAAFCLFVFNQFKVLSGTSLDLHGTEGALVLTGFLALGILVQFAKLIEGHRHWFEFLITLILLTAHIGAEVAIWQRTQITHAGLPQSLPLYIVGLYWLIGAVDIAAMFLPRELALFRGESEVQRLAREKAALEEKLNEKDTKLKLAEQSQEFVERLQASAQPSQAIAEQMIIERDCPKCGRTFRGSSEQRTANAVNAHLRTCSGGVASTNGHHQKEHV
jgi:hypothetical protein